MERGESIQRNYIPSSRYYNVIWKCANEQRVRVGAGGESRESGNSIVRGDALAWEAAVWIEANLEHSGNLMQYRSL